MTVNVCVLPPQIVADGGEIVQVGGGVSVNVAEHIPTQFGAAICVTVALYVPATPTVMDCVVAVNPPGPVHEKLYRVAGSGNGLIVKV